MVVYLDHAATSPIRPEVLETYTRYLTLVGNPSSVHIAGQTVRRALEEAREEIAKAIKCNRNEVIFTSGGTESDNLAIKGLFWQRHNVDAERNVILSAYTEHHAVIDPIEWLEKEQGAEAVWIPVDERGVVDLVWLKNYLAENAPRVALITLMWANNETGVVTPISEVTALAAVHDIPVHSDAVAALGHVHVDFAASGLAAMSITAHKVGGPVGVGALVVSRQSKLTSLVHGGGQERAMRSGTMNAAGAKAFSHAVSLAVSRIDHHVPELVRLRDRLVAGVHELVTDARFSRGDAPGLPDNAHFTFPGCSGDSLLFLLDRAGICVSNGSACQAGVTAASHVLLTMGRDEAEASGCIRVTLGIDTTDADVDAFLAALPAAHEGARRAGYTTS
jgi:cysteine desulfurase